MFYPSFGYRMNLDSWAVVIQGCVYHQQVTWLRRKPVLAVIRRAMRVDREGSDFFKQRMRQFLVHFSAGRTVSVQLGQQTAAFGPSEQAGLIRGELVIGNEDVALARTGTGPEASWIPFRAVLPEGDTREFVGRAQLLEPHGVSIISDVDDTLKFSNVPNRRDLFQNTFARDFVPIPGMSELFRKCGERGAAFHYVSGSPWQLYEPLAEFWASEGYPAGSFHLKRFRLRESAGKLHRMSPQMRHKQAAIAPILDAFPQRRFVLVGDSGEQDPDIYAYFLRERPQQVAHVFIRTVRGLAVDLPRLMEAFAGLPKTSWTAYEAANEIEQQIQELTAIEVEDQASQA